MEEDSKSHNCLLFVCIPGMGICGYELYIDLADKEFQTEDDDFRVIKVLFAEEYK